MPDYSSTDTIAAIATAPGEGAVAIVRLSGPDTYAMVDRLFRCPSPPPSERPPSTFVYGHVLAPDGEVLDDALLLIFRAPHSYTGEDAVEIQCHGGTQSARRILAALISTGARQAEPGEFTKRAFCNGRIDLTQAEAVLDLIHARSERAARLATAQLEHALGRRIQRLYDDLIQAAADVEAMLDFPDDELPQTVADIIQAHLSSVVEQIQTLLATWKEGHLLRDGARVVIAGSPNVGKSTLLNLLAGRNRAIVSPHPGTTRDTIEESVTFQGLPIQLIDTAGLRDAPCEIEQEGIRRTRHALSQADLCLCLLDGSLPLSADEQAFLNAHNPLHVLVLINKTDLGRRITPDQLRPFEAIPVSLLQNPHPSELIQRIVHRLLPSTSDTGHEPFAVSERHKSSLSIALNNLHQAISILSSRSEAEYVLAAAHVRSAVEPIGFILGKNCPDDMLDSIFSRFCVGK